MKTLKSRDQLIKELEYWKDSYSKTIKDLLDVKAEYETLKNAYCDDLDDVINILIKMHQRLHKNEYVMKHAKKK